jgi:hypothetical protein
LDLAAGFGASGDRPVIRGESGGRPGDEGGNAERYYQGGGNEYLCHGKLLGKAGLGRLVAQDELLASPTAVQLALAVLGDGAVGRMADEALRIRAGGHAKGEDKSGSGEQLGHSETP